ncbi:MAG: hypothetical protein ABIJ18_03310 [archaeon]
MGLEALLMKVGKGLDKLLLPKEEKDYNIVHKGYKSLRDILYSVASDVDSVYDKGKKYVYEPVVKPLYERIVKPVAKFGWDYKLYIGLGLLWPSMYLGALF